MWPHEKRNRYVRYYRNIAISNFAILYRDFIVYHIVSRTDSQRCIFAFLCLIRTIQSEHIGQWATPHDRRLGGIGRVVPIAEQ